MNLVAQSFFTFEVASFATKKQVEKELLKRFNVNILSVKIINLHPKSKTQRSRKGHFLQGGMKKAIVRLKKGEKIPLFEQVTKQEVEVRTAEGEVMTTVKENKNFLKGTKVKIEKTADSEKLEKEADVKRVGKTSQKEDKKKKGGK